MIKAIKVLSVLFLLSLTPFSEASAMALSAQLEENLNADNVAATLLPSVSYALNLNESAVTNYLEVMACDLYDKFQFSGMENLNYSLFLMAYKGYMVMKREDMISNGKYLTIMDFTRSSNQRRMWVLDMEQQRVVLNDLVSHGRNSGEEYARSFSNTPESFKSSLGFYVTGTPYMGKNDYSLRLHGVEEGFNDNALDRGIVMHGADYVSTSHIRHHKRLGRSQGCPAVSPRHHKWLIDILQGGSCMFIYYPDKKYLKTSQILNAPDPTGISASDASYATIMP